jgi:hypothetical protein
MAELLAATKKFLAAVEGKATVRQVFYRLIAMHLVPKTELLAATKNFLAAVEGKATVRHTFYSLAALGFVPNTQRGYQALNQHVNQKENQ